MKQRVIRVCDGSFTGRNGEEVCGKYIYGVPVEAAQGANPERIFLTAERLDGVQLPYVGQTIYVFRNSYGRVVDFVPAT